MDWELNDYVELKEARWEWMVGKELERRGKSGEDLVRDAKGACYKAEIASWLNMGHPSRVSNIREIQNI